MSHYILCIDTSLDVCSVALADSSCSDILCLEEKGFNIHAARLTLMIEALMKKAGMQLKDIDAICIDKGPGSYTGLRIGVSTAKGLCYALNKPLISTHTLETMARFALGHDENKMEGETLICPMIDARRMEVYYTLYNKNLESISETKAGIVTEAFLEDILKDQKIMFFGNGMEKCRALLEHNPNAIFLSTDIYPRADYMAEVAIQKFNDQDFENIFSFEPFYLKDFMTAQMIKAQ